MTQNSKQILDGEGVERCLKRLASEIVDDCDPEVPLALVGIRSGGMPLAERLAQLVEVATNRAPSLGAIDITLYRDDLYTGLEKPSLGETVLPFALDGYGVVLVDDVLFTGRTVRAAMGELHDYGRPRWIRLAVLVDRGHRELPIQADFVGRRVESKASDRVQVELKRDGVAGGAFLIGGQA
ncbi:MAG: bifunctional pyr operon transcriptional regulator/uracil phosphoribosyltransferase [Rickettsiales bacterium]|nr:bifunctional pyr operon transcriptional regulator/uracil phosphoribosyltransferase [Rickettsiales bacterium]